MLGAVLFLFLVRFCLVGRAPLVYCGAFLITSYLEIVGTNLGSLDVGDATTRPA